MKTIAEDARERGPLVSDGAWGTFLFERGMRSGECPELWNLTRPDDVRAVAAQYIEAGADVVTTNSFGASPVKLAAYGLVEEAARINEAAARLSREAAGARVHVMASIGPTGKILMMGDVSEDELYDGFRVQAEAFERGGADACLVETMSAIDEAVLAIRAVRDNTDLEVVCTFTYDRILGDEAYTMMGVTPAAMAAAALEAGAGVIGSNCSQGPREMLSVVRGLAAAAPQTPILAQPNAGMARQRPDGSTCYPLTPAEMGALVPELVRAGARIVGGCCGTGPAHIRAIRQAVDGLT